VQKISNFIFNHSPKKIAMFFILGPLFLSLIYLLITILFRTISGVDSENEIFAHISLNTLYLLFGVIVFFWLFWLKSTVYTVNKVQLGLPRKWFNIAFSFLWVYIFFNIAAEIIQKVVDNGNLTDEYMFLIYSSRELISFGGILIAYPIVCHYAARATMAKRNSKPATLINAIPFSLLLIFGTVLGIPFMHPYFSDKVSSKKEVIIIYVIGFSLFFLMLVIGFIAAITGMV